MIVPGPTLDLGKADGIEPDCLIFHFAPPNDECNRGNDCRKRQ
jgi:hypothetical protein